MKSKVLVYFCILLISILTLCVFSGCHKAEELPVPENVTVEKRVVTWDAVENATGYTVRINGEEYQTSENRFPVYSLTADGGQFFIDVLAKGEGKKYSDSGWLRIDVTLDAVPTEGYDEALFHYTLLEDKSGYELSRGYCNLDGVITIPDSFSDYPVKKIAKYAFSYDISVGTTLPDCFTENACNIQTTGVILPQGLESIGMCAFAYVIRMEEIVIPDTVTEIGLGAFDGCKAMRKVTLPKTLKEIPTECFRNTALDEIVLPEALETIGPRAFQCEYVDYDRLPEEKRHIWSELSKIEIPEKVKTVYHEAFRGRENLSQIVFHGKLEALEPFAFHDTAWFHAQPDGLVLLDRYLYLYKGEMPENFTLTIPADVGAIAGGAFEVQLNLEKVIIPNGIELTGSRIFRSCKNLTEVILPDDLKIIPRSAFNGCELLKHITIPDTVTHIGVAALAGSGLESITIPSSVRIIDERAFMGCESLASIYIHDGVERICSGAFRLCKKLTDLHLPNTLKVIENATFSQCDAMEKIIIPKSVESLPKTVFPECENLAFVFYEGDAAQWKELTREMDFSSKYPPFASATIAIYSEQAPDGEGIFWHYENGSPVLW